MNRTYTTTQLRSFPWIVSSATLRAEDLALSWSSAAEELLELSGEDLDSRLSAEELELLVIAASSAAEEPSSSQLQELSELCNETLFDLLQELSPVGFSFSSHTGDGALFGFWLSEEIAEELERCSLDSEDPSTVAELLQELDSLGADLCDLTDSFQGFGDGVTEEEAGADFAFQLWEEVDPSPLEWPLRCIDWRQAWFELRCDGFSLVRFSPSRFSVWRF